MEVSLEQAIEIHAKVLNRIHGKKASSDARKKANQLAEAGDQDGYRVWMKVGEAAERLQS
jgi:hypothetical protein